MATYTDITPKFSNNSLIGYDKVTDLEAINNSIMNLFSIQQGEVPGKPWLGSPISVFVFDNIGFFEEKQLETNLRNTLELYEPRVELIDLTIDSQPEYNSLNIDIQYVIIIDVEEIFETVSFSLAHNSMTSISTRK